MADPVVVVIPDAVAAVLRRLNEALTGNVILAGGWAVHCLLAIAGRNARPTEDVDVALSRGLRPAKAALEAINALQDDQSHAARLSGLPLVVDLLADDVEEAIKVEPGLVEDADGLRLMVPPFADLFATGARLVLLQGRSDSAEVLLPRAGALFASKLGGLYLELRAPAKRASDAADALSILEAYGPRSLAEDLADAPKPRRKRVADWLENVGYSALAAQARLGGAVPFPDGPTAVPLLVELLRQQ